MRLRRRGFTLAELLVAMFVLAMAVGGAVAVIVVAGRSADGARDRLLAEELARTALASSEVYAQEVRMANGGALALSYNITTNNALSPWPAYEQRDPRVAPPVGWVWRAHSFDPVIGAYCLDIWVFRNPGEPSVSWGNAVDSESKRQQTLLYLQTKLETRKP